MWRHPEGVRREVSYSGQFVDLVRLMFSETRAVGPEDLGVLKDKLSRKREMAQGSYAFWDSIRGIIVSFGRGQV